MASAFGDLVIKLGLNTVEYREGLDRAQYLTAQFSAGAAAKIAAVGTLAVQATNTALSAISSAITALPDTIQQTVARLDTLGEASTRLGVSAEFLQAFNYQLGLAGVSGEAGEKGIQKFQQQLVRAQAGAEDAGKIFRALGIDVRKFAGDVEGGLSAAIDKLSAVSDPNVRNALSREILGKAGAGVAAAFDEGAASIAKAREELAAFGALAGNDFVAQAGALQDNLDKLKVAGTAFGLAITEAVTPALLALTSEFVESKKGPSGLRDEIRALTAQGDTVLAFAQGVSAGVAKVGDVLVLAAKGFAVVGDAVKLAVNDLRTFGLVVFEVAKIGGNLLTASFSDLPGLIGRSVQQIKTLVAERNAVLARGNLDLIERFAPGSASVVSDLVDRTITPFIARARERLASGNVQAPRAPRVQVDVDPVAAFGAKAPAVKDPFEGQLRELEKQAVTLQFAVEHFDKYRNAAEAAKAAGIDFEIAVGKFSDRVRQSEGLAPLKPSDIELIRTARDRIIEFGQAAEQLKVGQQIKDRIAVIDLETDALRKGNVEREKAVELEKLRKSGVSSTADAFIALERQLDESLRRRERTRGLIDAETFGRGLDDQVAAIRLETQALGLNEVAVRDLTEARRLDLEVRNATRNADNTLRVEPEVEQAFRSRANDARRALDQATRDRVEAERSARAGVQSFAREYIENANNAAKQAQQFLSTVASGLEDQIVKVFRDGKLDVKAFFDTIAEEALRLTARNLIGDLFSKAGLDKANGGSGALSGTSVLGGLAGLFGGGGGARDIRSDPNFDPSLAYGSAAQADNTSQQLGLVASVLKGIVGLFGGTFATGGELGAGRWGIVGENGPEIAFAPAGGMQIFPAQPMATSASGGGAPIYQTNNFSVQGQLDRRSEQQIAAATYRGAQNASRRNN